MTQAANPAGHNLKWLGMILVVLGILSIVAPAVAGTTVVIVVGFILLIAGTSSAIRGWYAATGTEKMLGIVLGVVTTLAGMAVIAQPLLGLSFLTLLLAVYFLAEGVSKIVVSLRYRPTGGWVWLLVSGALSLILGALIWSQWPVSGLWAVGLLVGLNLLSTGLALLTLASVMRKVAGRVASLTQPA